MYSHYDELERRQKADKLFREATLTEWNKLKETEKRLYRAVCAAWKKNGGNARHADNENLWVTRDQIADQLEAYRLIPYYLKLLDHLGSGQKRYKLGVRNTFIEASPTGLHWIQKAKRPRWRYAAGSKRPAGYEWTYCPRDDIMKAILEPQAIEPAPALPVPTLKQRPRHIIQRSKLERVADWIHNHFYW